MLVRSRVSIIPETIFFIFFLPSKQTLFMSFTCLKIYGKILYNILQVAVFMRAHSLHYAGELFLWKSSERWNGKKAVKI